MKPGRIHVGLLFRAATMTAWVVVALTVLLIGVGVVTTSALAGVVARRPRTAFKALFLQLGGVGGTFCGAGLAVLVMIIGEYDIPLWMGLVPGAAAGGNAASSQIGQTEMGKACRSGCGAACRAAGRRGVVVAGSARFRARRPDQIRLQAARQAIDRINQPARENAIHLQGCRVCRSYFSSCRTCMVATMGSWR